MLVEMEKIEKIEKIGNKDMSKMISNTPYHVNMFLAEPPFVMNTHLMYELPLEYMPALYKPRMVQLTLQHKLPSWMKLVASGINVDFPDEPSNFIDGRSLVSFEIIRNKDNAIVFQAVVIGSWLYPLMCTTERLYGTILNNILRGSPFLYKPGYRKKGKGSLASLYYISDNTSVNLTREGVVRSEPLDLVKFTRSFIDIEGYSMRTRWERRTYAWLRRNLMNKKLKFR